MFEAIAPLITAIKSAGPPVYAAVLLATLLLLFLPGPIIAQLGLAEFKIACRTYAGLALIASGSLLFVHVIGVIGGFFSCHWRSWRSSRNRLKMLSELTYEEKAFLAAYVHAGQNTIYTAISDGVAGGLEAKGIIYRSSNVSGYNMEFPYNLQPLARKLLNHRPQLLR